MGAEVSTVSSDPPRNGENFLYDYDNHEGVHTTTDKTQEVEIRCAENGPASSDPSKGGVAPTTLCEMLKTAATKHADRGMVYVEEGVSEVKDGKVPEPLPLDQWKKLTYKGLLDEVSNFAKALISIGFEQHDAVGIFGFNSVEWIVSTYGAIFAGGIVAGMYPTDNAEQVAYKSKLSGCVVGIAEDAAKMQKFAEKINETPKLKAIVVWGDAPTDPLTRDDGSVVNVYKWNDFVALSKEVDDAALDARIAAQKPGHCCCLIYTSGTTGNPKAVMLSHDNLIFESHIVMLNIPKYGVTATEERVLSYLPLSHIAGMMLDIIAPITCAATRPGWVGVYIARNYDLKYMSLGARMKSVKPTVFLGVPRVWEKIAEKMKAIGKTTTGLKKQISTFAKSKGLEHAKNCELGGTGEQPFLYGFAKDKVLMKVREALGLEHCHFGVTGAAPITVETLEYFAQLGIQINEVYGMSECSAATTWSTDEAHVWGSCGYPMPGVEVQIFNDKNEPCPLAENIRKAPEETQGEICFRGRHIMMGYLANPDLGEEHVAELKKKTDESVDSKGWCRSGDKGCLGKNGMVKITGRYKELIITAGGENVAPVPIEDEAKTHLPEISNIVMIGDKRKFNCALITLKCEGATGYVTGTNVLAGAAAAFDPEIKTVEDAINSEKYMKHIEDGLVLTNKVAPNNASKIQKFTVLPLDISLEDDDLTATLKLKRSVVANKYHNAIEAIYNSKGGCYVPFNNSA